MQAIVIFLQNHLLMTAALVAVLVLLVILELIKLKQGAVTVSPREATQLMNHHQAIVVDLRNQEAYRTGHITGALSLPFNTLPDKIKTIEKYKSQPIILTCPQGKESIQAYAILAKAGFQNTRVLAGGIQGWKMAEMPLVKD